MCLSLYIPQNYSQPNISAYSIEQKMGKIVTKKPQKIIMDFTRELLP